MSVTVPGELLPSLEGRRLLIVSNRMPVTIKKSEAGDYTYSKSSGGLATGLQGLKETVDFLWYGWPGRELPEENVAEIRTKLLEDHNAIPVLMDDKLADSHYNGFTNSILWPLFHYQPSDLNFEDEHWEAYVQANRVFAKALAQDVMDGDLVWIHDYHLMLLPKMLREEIGDSRSDVRLGFFLHIPFPSSDIFGILPTRTEILDGLLYSNTIGFHTYDYARHFLNSCIKFVSAEATPCGLSHEGRHIAVEGLPIGIDYNVFYNGLKQSTVQDYVQQLKEQYCGLKLIIGVERLDYIKGVPQKLHAFESFLEAYPEWIGKVSLLQVAVPSRDDVKEYKNLKDDVSLQVTLINGKFGHPGWTPIHWLHQSVDFLKLIALYAVADVCLVTSTRDGMNLVSCEFIAAQQEKRGVLILSEFAGSAQALHGAMVVNPWRIDEVAKAMHDSLSMPDQERISRFHKLNKHVARYTSAFWGQSFVSELMSDSLALKTNHDMTDTAAPSPANAVRPGEPDSVEGMTLGDLAIGDPAIKADQPNEADG